jgi:hypothetical protein
MMVFMLCFYLFLQSLVNASNVTRVDITRQRQEKSITASSYNITISLIRTGLIQSDIKTFRTAAKRWQQLVVGDMPGIRSSGYEMPWSGCKAPKYVGSEVIPVIYNDGDNGLFDIIVTSHDIDT